MSSIKKRPGGAEINRKAVAKAKKWEEMNKKIPKIETYFSINKNESLLAANADKAIKCPNKLTSFTINPSNAIVNNDNMTTFTTYNEDFMSNQHINQNSTYQIEETKHKQNTDIGLLITNAETAVICPNEVSSFMKNLPDDQNNDNATINKTNDKDFTTNSHTIDTFEMNETCTMGVYPICLPTNEQNNFSESIETKIPNIDPALWEINFSNINYLLLNPSKQNLKLINLKKTKRVVGNNKRTLFENQDKGFTDWKKCYNKVSEHEKSLTHVQSVKSWHLRMINSSQCGIDKEMKKEIINYLSYWKNVLHRVVETLKFITSRGLALRGTNEHFGSEKNGNYLGCLELIAKFDPFTSEHIKKYGNKGHGNVSYLSSVICDEFIILMCETVVDKIIVQVKTRKYFSLIIDSTPDISKTDQLTIDLRYVMLDGTPVERFIGFLPSVGHKGKDMTKAVIEKLSIMNIDIKNCRGQAYDNASNMSGMFNGLQSQIKQYSSNAEFIPCSTHSLNLVGSNAAECTPEGTTFFYTAQMIYNLFALSTYRWELLCNLYKALLRGYDKIKDALLTISNDDLQKKEAKHEALSIFNKISTLEFDFMILVRNNFDQYLLESQQLCGKNDFLTKTSRTKKQVKFADETSSKEIIHEGFEKMKNEVFLVILDYLISDLNRRKKAYSNINNNFGFFLNLEKESTENIKNYAEKLIDIYPDDIEKDFIEEVLQFKDIICNFSIENKSSLLKILKSLIQSQLSSTFPNVEIALRIFCSFPCSNVTEERSFSVLKRVKNYLRSFLSSEKLSALSILNIENEILKQIEWEQIIHKFASGKVTRKKLI
ncbi:hypothetical protein AGLY_003354 [Aphis glycines]|uniref:DUF4371 domain-containing protein n=1 Tax=Aphis glycines TaxID=307491 RepID=A0A6G0U0N1_APHGL|nr:hypothetical protein AGLY_003354 [Aphis glycines]